MAELSQSILKILACPACLADLDINSKQAQCSECGVVYPINERGQLDLRLRGRKRYTIDFEVGEDSAGKAIPLADAIPPNPNPQIDYRSIPIEPLLMRGNRITRELLSYFPRFEQGGMLLDLGCGGEPFREVCSHTNLEYVGIEYDGDTPKILADAHSLPFKDGSFDFVISFAVLEHIRYPFVAMREAARVMKPGASFIGTVAFLEPFHLNSYYHPSHLGTHNLITSAGLEVEHLEPNVSWTGLRAQAWMTLFPHAPMALSNLLVLPVHLLHRLWWALGRLAQNRPATSERARRTSNTGGFRFICRKPAGPVDAPARTSAASGIEQTIAMAR